MGMSRLIGLLFAGAFATIWAEQAVAAPTDEFAMANNVLSRSRPGLDPQGLHLGGFTLYPTLLATLAYDDNVFDTDTLTRKSGVYSIQPSVSLRSNWSVHQFNLDAGGLIQRYTNASEADFDQFNVAGAGRIDVSSNARLSTTGHFARATEPRGSIGDIFIGANPVVYRTFGGAEAAKVDLGHFQLSASGGVDRFVYNNVRVGSTIQSQKYRNRNDINALVQLGWEVGPGIVGFVQGRYDKERYDIRTSTGTLNSHGWTVQGGVDFKITSLIVGRVGVGYLERNYQDSRFRSVNGLSYDASIVWNVTTLVTLTMNADKAVEESPDINVSGIISNHAGAKVDWEILRNILFNGRVGYTVERYRGLSRTDRRNQEGAGVRYLANRFLEIGLDYDRRDQNGSGLFGRDYKGNSVQLSIKLQR